MPYLDSKIELSKHRKNCGNPVGKRLYIRDYDDKGKQKFVSWGLTCTTCGVVVKEKYERNLTPRELKYVERQKKFESEGSEYSKLLIQRLGGRSMTWQQSLESRRTCQVEGKLKRLERKLRGPRIYSHGEAGLRTRTRNLKHFYEWMNRYEHSDISWDNALVEQFLHVYPRPTIKELVEIFEPSDSVISVDSQKVFRYRGYVPNPDKPDFMKYDFQKYKELLKSEALKHQDMMREIINSRGSGMSEGKIILQKRLVAKRIKKAKA
jgi:hypothetical protein